MKLFTREDFEVCIDPSLPEGVMMRIKGRKTVDLLVDGTILVDGEPDRKTFEQRPEDLPQEHSPERITRLG